MSKLKEILKEKFPDHQIVKLRDFTRRIAGISKVRYGNNCHDTNYDEISLNNVDEYGYIYIPDEEKKSKPANSTALINQQLYKNDLMMLHRGKIGKVGIIGSGYRRIVVGNNSMIRIQFLPDRKVDTPWFVMEYLQLDYVKEYIDTYIPSSGSASRKILNPEVIANLPIPDFKECEGKYKKMLLQRKELRIKSDELSRRLKRISDEYKILEIDSVALAVEESERLYTYYREDVNKLKKLEDLQKECDKLEFRNSIKTIKF